MQIPSTDLTNERDCLALGNTPDTSGQADPQGTELFVYKKSSAYNGVGTVSINCKETSCKFQFLMIQRTC